MKRTSNFSTLRHALTYVCNDTLKAGTSIRRSISVTLPTLPPKVDILFGSDLTSSMGDEVAKVKSNSTNIMNQITSLVANTHFGAISFKDYAASYKHCGYQTSTGGAVLYGSGQDYPYRLDQAITSSKANVSTAINSWTLSNDPNTDYPATYTRALWELYNDNNISWRSGSKRFLLLFGDALPHDCSFVVSPYTINTGVDPGRDGKAGTSDDLTWSSTIAGLKANNISVITLYSGPGKLKLGGGPPLNIFKFWEQHSQATGGDAYQLDQKGNLPQNANIANFIKQQVQNLSATVSTLTIALCKDQDKKYANWLSNPDSKTNVSSGTGPHSLAITVTPPQGQAKGAYDFDICIYGDGVEYARQRCRINVTDCQLPGLGDPCSAGLGACKRTGVKQCNSTGTALVCSVTAGTPTTEVCDGIDNDCDGPIDENFTNKGQTCTVGQGECLRNGNYVCKTDKSGTECSVTAGTPTTEKCDGKDNDCDGQIDETFSTKGQACTSGLGECQRSGVLVCKSDGSSLVCSASPGTPTTEKCDGKDNDCDGQIDETFLTKGQGCTVGQGECRNNGTFICKSDGSSLVCSASPGTPTTETCDGKDNDCDGQIDENFSQKGQACAVGLGECRRTGTFVCKTDGSALTCSVTAGTPTIERCDGKDNDCDGQIDENFSAKNTACAVGLGECRRTGTFVCKTDGSALTCSVTAGTPTTEKCDGKDNDCDGQIDESWSNKGSGCAVGLGECRRTGTYVCKTDATGVVCSTSPGTPTTERCDGKDNDCDGQIDENFSQKGQSCTVGKGTCQRSGRFVCATDGSKLVCSTSPGTPSTERCDGLDNDCDGAIDENFSQKGQACTLGLGECKRSGTFACKTDGSGLVCNAIQGTPTPERCDGKDNDCDGQIDENFSDKGKACTVGRGECVRTGSFLCKSDGSGLTCSVSPGTPRTEVCDRKDNDCDGQTDEGCQCVSGSRSCYSGTSDTQNNRPCRSGTQTCSNGKWGNCIGQVLPGTEKCDGIDNDCDGNIDEDFPEKSKSCKVGRGACQRSGRFVCKSDGSQTVCNVTAGSPTSEKCDGVDNDCDGTVDENFTQKGQTCTVGAGPCKSSGTYQCNSTGTGVACSASAGSGSSEKCDGLDNDCDGKVDEDFAQKGSSCQVGKGVCVRTGKQVCKSDGSGLQCSATPGIPSVEKCDGKDNDCDGSVDEGFAKGSSCTVGVGLCKKAGSLVCKTDGSGLQCSATPGKPVAERCDGKDNDCDGAVDEDFPTLNQSCSAGQGNCVNTGKFVCSSTQRGVECSAKPTNGSAERCDGKDNDCDGKVDEDFANLKKPCTNGKGECKATGVFQCSSDGKTTQCSAKPLRSSPEVCDGKDNDCDGPIDENLTRSCSTACGAGTQVCKNKAWGACSGPQPQKEVCDNKDNDCDGRVDNNLTRPCKTACGQGTESCQQGKWATCSAPQPKQEVCDGKDNDCDGKVDEEIPSKPCKGACGSGTAYCESGVFIGCTGLQPKPEVCDGVDNDCDGKVDNLDPRLCRSECGEGKETCIGGIWKNCSAPKPKQEVCDGLDNNCDGFIDNDVTCPSKQGCYQGQCRPTCQQDKDCGADSKCVEGFCMGDPCKGVECPKDKRCVRGHCVDACALLTCPDGQVCRDGKCLDNNCEALGCPGGQVCQSGKCVPDPCLLLKCPTGQVCQDGECKAIEPGNNDIEKDSEGGIGQKNSGDAGSSDSGQSPKPAGACNCQSLNGNTPLPFGWLLGFLFFTRLRRQRGQ